MGTEEIASAAVIGALTSLLIQAARQHAPAWFDGPTVTLAAFLASLAVTLAWYLLGGIPEADSWQLALRIGVLAFLSNQTFWATFRTVGLQPVGKAGTAGAPPDSGMTATTEGGPSPNANGRMVATGPAYQVKAAEAEVVQS